MTIALLDGDLVAYRSAAAAEKDSFPIARHYMEQTIDTILAETGATEFRIALSGPNNFRYQVYPEYKANRVTQQRPQFLTECKDFLHFTYNAEYSDNCEADDLLGIWQTEDTANTIICSLDKDLRQVPGRHFSWEISGTSTRGGRWTKAAEHLNVTPFEGLKWFYTQTLIGDVADNIKGVSGVGIKRAEAALSGCTTEQELFEAVLSMYTNEEEFLMNGKCLWVFRKPNDVWEFPKFE